MKIVKVNNLPQTYEADTIYIVKSSTAGLMDFYVTDSTGLEIRALPIDAGVIANLLPRSEVGVTAASLVDGKIPVEQLPSAILGALSYKGTWNANTNTPAIPTASESNKGWYYVVSVSGATNINGESDWVIGDWIVSNGTAWGKVDNSDRVSSVAGKTGVVVLDKADVGLGNVDNTSDANKAVLSATKLTTARTINGVSFDGTANITVADNTKLPLTGGTVTGELISSAANSFRIKQGNYGVFWRNDGVDTYLMVTASGDQDGTYTAARPFKLVNATGIASINGNAATATKLATARTINGVNFDGTENVSVPVGWSAVTGKPAVIAAGTDAAAARAAIGAASLVGGKIPEHELPALAITDVFTVASQTAMLALTAERGDVAVRSDLNKSFALAAEPASTLANWVELRTPTDVVLSVAGKTGSVTLAKADVGLSNVDNTSDATKPVSTATQNALNLKANLASPSFIGTVAANSSSASVSISALLASNSGFESRAQGSEGTAGAATIAFHRPGAHAVHFGLDTDNKLKVGGWSLGANAYAIYHENNKPTKVDVGLSAVDNTSDANKPVSTAQQNALNLKANLASPAFTGTPTAPTAIVGTNTTQLATTAYVITERTAEATLANKVLKNTREVRVAMVGSNDIDLWAGNVFTKTISGATAFTVSNKPFTGHVASFILELTNGGSSTVYWFSGVKWAGGTAPTLTASGVDVLGFYSHDGGTTWRGMMLAKDSK